MSLLHRTSSGTKRKSWNTSTSSKSNSSLSLQYGNGDTTTNNNNIDIDTNESWGSHSSHSTRPARRTKTKTSTTVLTKSSQRKHADNDKKKANKRRSSSGKGSSSSSRLRCCCSSWMTTNCGIVTFFLLVIGHTYYSSYHERQMMEAQRMEQDATMHELEIDMARKFDAKVKEVRSENAVLKQQLSEQEGLKIQLASREDSIVKMQHQLDTEQRDIKFLGSEYKKVATAKTKLQQNIQLLSRTILLEKFGPGPHTLDIHLRFDSHKGFDDGGILKIEMAPVDEMPHAVYWFLEQVSRKLFDGFSFYQNAGHVLQAGAVPNFLTPPGNDHRPSEDAMKKAGFHQLLFQEYSETFPHDKYTIGFAGRPGGPSIYINTQNNTRSHGPGGQMKYDDPAEADSCFAKIIDGFDLVDRMMTMPVKEGTYHSIQDNIAIVQIRIRE